MVHKSLRVCELLLVLALKLNRVTRRGLRTGEVMQPRGKSVQLSLVSRSRVSTPNTGLSKKQKDVKKHVGLLKAIAQVTSQKHSSTSPSWWLILANIFPALHTAGTGAGLLSRPLILRPSH